MTDNRPTIVVDATVMIKWYLPELYTDESLRLLDTFNICTVDIAMSQVGNALWKRIRTGEVKPHEGKRIISSLERMPIRFVPMSVLAVAAMELAAISTRTFNESLYFVLALREHTKVVTADFRWYGMLSTGKLKSYVGFVNEI